MVWWMPHVCNNYFFTLWIFLGWTNTIVFVPFVILFPTPCDNLTKSFTKDFIQISRSGYFASCRCSSMSPDVVSRTEFIYVSISYGCRCGCSWFIFLTRLGTFNMTFSSWITCGFCFIGNAGEFLFIVVLVVWLLNFFSLISYAILYFCITLILFRSRILFTG